MGKGLLLLQVDLSAISWTTPQAHVIKVGAFNWKPFTRPQGQIRPVRLHAFSVSPSSGFPHCIIDSSSPGAPLVSCFHKASRFVLGCATCAWRLSFEPYTLSAAVHHEILKHYHNTSKAHSKVQNLVMQWPNTCTHLCVYAFPEQCLP